MSVPLHIPQGINFECTGCGNCCLEWPVPITAEDEARIMVLAGQIPQATGQERLFRPLKATAAKMQAFTHTLEKRQDGRCAFLTEETRCLLHANWGAEAKPAMCQLFPYTFNETPSGVYVSVSFASTGVLLNSGRALSEQTDFMSGKWDHFRRLFPGIHPDWSQTQLIDGRTLAWSNYLEVEDRLIQLTRIRGRGRTDKVLASSSRAIIDDLLSGTDLEKEPRLEARPKTVDQLLLKALFDLYLPDDVFASTQTDLDTQALLRQFVSPPPAVSLRSNEVNYSFQQLLNHRLGDLDEQSENLLSRFAYCRIFAKLYFSAGFANLSLLAGLHHLIFLLALVRIKIKIAALSSAGHRPEFLEIVEIVRALERRLSQVSLSKESVAILEVLLTSPERLERVLSIAA